MRNSPNCEIVLVQFVILLIHFKFYYNYIFITIIFFFFFFTQKWKQASMISLYALLVLVNLRLFRCF